MTEKTPLRVYCMPISGVHFPLQLGIVSAISQAVTYSGTGDVKLTKPDVVLGSSGGNIAAYYAFSCDWNKVRILSSTGMLSQESFITSWMDYIPTWIFLPFSKSLFRQGFGFENFFKRIFTSGQIKYGPEIWTGTVRSSTRDHVVFTNKAKNQTILTPRISNPMLRPNFSDAVEAVYLDGNLSNISKITQASASIPWVVNPVEFNEDLYSDGGSIYASPLICFADQLKELGKTQYKIQMSYFSPFNVDNSPKAMFDIIKELGDLMKGSSSHDMNIFLSIISELGANSSIPEHHDVSSPEKLWNMLNSLENNEEVEHYAILYYPKDDETTIDLANKFHYVDLIRSIVKTEKSLQAYVWKT